MSKVDPPRFRFGTLERRGVLAGLRGPQLAVVFSAALAAVLALRIAPSLSGLALATLVASLGTFLAFVPLSGRTTEEWMPVVGSWALRSLIGKRSFVSSAPTSGRTVASESQPDLPGSLEGVMVLAHPVPGTRGSLGVIHDKRAGTYTGVLEVQGKSFALLDPAEKTRRLSSWAGTLAGLAREGGAIHRIQWVERTVPDPGNEIGGYLKENIVVPLDSPIARSYLQVVDQAGPVTQAHEVFVALQIHAAKAARSIKAAGGGDAGACEVLRRELTTLSANLMGTEVTVNGALTPRLVAYALRTAFDPGCRRRLISLSSRDPLREGTTVGQAGPIATEESWSTYHSDGAWHATYWVAEWPRIDTDADFLTPLLLRTEAMRTVSLTMEPVSPLKAIRAVESARTSAAADEELRERGGFVTTTRRRKEQDALADHERDLADGHAFFRFAGFITVSAFSREELDSSCGEIEEAAGRSLLDIRRLSGEQAEAFTYTLPLARGLR